MISNKNWKYNLYYSESQNHWPPRPSPHDRDVIYGLLHALTIIQKCKTTLSFNHALIKHLFSQPYNKLLQFLKSTTFFAARWHFLNPILLDFYKIHSKKRVWKQNQRRKSILLEIRLKVLTGEKSVVISWNPK